jgi:hypothetical protein
MADRNVRDAIILSKSESTYGTDATPTAADNAQLVSNFSVTPLNAQNVSRDLIRGYLGGAEALVGDRYISAQYGIEAVGSGTAGTAPAWGDQLLACGMAETETSSTRVDYTLVSTGFGSLTNYYHDSGVKHVSTGTRGSFDLRLELGERPMFDFTMLGLYNNETAASQPTDAAYTAFKTPQAITNANSADVVLGCTHNTTGAPALASGTTYPSQGIRISLGLAVNHLPLLGGESIHPSQREVTGSITLDLTAAQEVTLMGNVRDATLTSIGFVHGTVTGRKLLVFMPYCQLINPQKVDVQGKRLISFDFRAVPSAGNDELRIVTSF